MTIITDPGATRQDDIDVLMAAGYDQATAEMIVAIDRGEIDGDTPVDPGDDGNG